MEKRSNPFIPIAILVAGVLVAGGLFLSSIRDANTQYKDTDTTPQFDFSEQTPVSTSDHILGSPNARITFIEYGDLDCPACKSIHPHLTRLIERYGKTGTVAWVFRHFPIEQLHAGTTYKAAASECVAALGGEQAFWQFIKTVFETTGEQTTDLIDLAEASGVSRDEFQACAVSGRYIPFVEASYEEARAIGARATPFVIITYPEGIPSAAISQIEQAGSERGETGAIVVANTTTIVMQAAFSYEVFDEIVRALLF